MAKRTKLKARSHNTTGEGRRLAASIISVIFTTQFNKNDRNKPRMITNPCNARLVIKFCVKRMIKHNRKKRLQMKAAFARTVNQRMKEIIE